MHNGRGKVWRNRSLDAQWERQGLEKQMESSGRRRGKQRRLLLLGWSEVCRFKVKTAFCVTICVCVSGYLE